MSTPSLPPRFGLGEPYSPSSLGQAGTIVVRPAAPYGFDAMFTTDTPCCHATVRVDAVSATIRAVGRQPIGVPRACRGCGRKWYVLLAFDGRRLDPLPRGTTHPGIEADQAEWVSRGFGTRP